MPPQNTHKWQQLAEQLRGQIADGTYPPGSLLPRQVDLAAQLGWSEVTVRRAYAVLQAEQLVTSTRHRGTVVNEPPHLSGRDRALAVRRTGRIYSPGEYAKITSAELVSAPDDVAAILGIEAGAPAIKRVRVTFGADDKPRSASTSWYDGAHAEAAPELLVADRITAGSWRYLEMQVGLQAVDGSDSIDTRLATPEDAEALALELPAAVKVSSTVLTTADGIVVEYGISISGSGRSSNYDYALPASN
ncbi:GntR family transcriptional regulator (plasmid) [Kitasatospora sp. NBC_01246]|uniref:GntR family transcriptional regulator n=1 Tax=Kitasatospora sp. NBC_01246 TaxID=2903570 RepID=UPI002E32F608|nr:GntR family transcriptional regulator [Kitasatospora sp. NBC_01246]